MNALAPEALRRGWCPSALRPMETGDGWLVRLHPPGAALTPSQLIRIAELAREHGNGLLEISARANLQIRGVSLSTHPALVETLLTERLVDEHDGDGPQRLTLTAPLLPHPARGGEGRGGGASPGRSEAAAGESRSARPPIPNPSPPRARRRELVSSLIDARSLADAIERAAGAIAGLPAKTLVIVDDGGPLSLDAFACDLRVVAVAQGLVAMGLPDGRWLGPVMPAEAPVFCAAMLRVFATAHRSAPETIRRLRDLGPDGMAGLIAASGLPLAAAPAARAAPRRAGGFAVADGDGVIIGLPFGRSDAATLDKLGNAALRAGARSIRLSPWRGLAFAGLKPGGTEPLLAVAAGLGLIVDPGDPRLSVQACAGRPGCARAHGDAMADAAALAQVAAPLLVGGATLHVSACVKSCAHPGPSDLTLVGGNGGYDVVVAGATRDAPIATLDLPAILARLRPGQDLFTRLSERGTTGPDH